MSDSLSTILGVVPEPIKAWKPDKRPAHDHDAHEGPDRCRTPPGRRREMKGVVAGIFSSGWAAKMPTASTTITPIFMYELR